jgi:putative hemolysin
MTLLEQVSDSEIIVDGRLPIEEIEAALGLSLTGDDDPYGTAAGFVHWHLDRMPQEGDQFDAHGIRAEVLDVEGNRLRRLRLSRIAIGDLPLESQGASSPVNAAAPVPEV